MSGLKDQVIPFSLKMFERIEASLMRFNKTATLCKTLMAYGLTDLSQLERHWFHS